MGVALVFGYYIVSKAVSESFLACGNVSNQCWEKSWSGSQDFFTVKLIKFATSVTEQHSKHFAQHPLKNVWIHIVERKILLL